MISFLVATQLFFHNLAEKVLAKILVDLFLLLFLRLNAQLECILPLNKGPSEELELDQTQNLIESEG